jgi:hypothetical protein
MNNQAIDEPVGVWLESAKRRLMHAVDRSNSLRLAVLVLANLAGVALMLSPLLIMAFTALIAVDSANQSEGALDWILFAIFGALCLLSGYLSVEFYLTRPTRLRAVPVTKQQAPELFDMVERSVSHHKTKPITHIALTTDAELRVQAVPKWPLPIFHEYTLVAGAPLMFFLSAAQFRVALAEAFGETARIQRGISGWAVQAAEDWPAIVEALQANPTPLSHILQKPATWIADITGELCSDLRSTWQQKELRFALANSEETTARDYLANRVIAISFLEKRFLPIMFRAAERYPTPSVKPFSQFDTILEKAISQNTARHWLRQAEATRGTDPLSLRDVLADLGFDGLRWSPALETNAFRRLFRSPDVLENLNRFWQKMIEPEWSRHHASFQRENTRFENLQTKSHVQPLHGTAAICYAQLATRFLNKEQAIAVYQEMYRTNLDSAAVCFACGREMLSAGQITAGSEAIQRAVNLDHSLADRARALLSQHKQGPTGENLPFAAVAQLA